VVFNRDLHSQGSLTSFTVRPAPDIASTLVEEVRAACRESMETSPPRPVLVLLFCYGIEDHALRLDYQMHCLGEVFMTGLPMRDFRAAVDSRVPLTLLVTAGHSDNWTVNPDMNLPAPTATDAACPEAEDGTTKRRLPNEFNPPAHLGRTFGTVFASSIIESLTSSTSPLLESPAEESYSLQPDDPTPEQAAAYDAFCDAIMDVLRKPTTVLRGKNGFQFAAQDDTWEKYWAARTGVPLDHFQRVWEPLPTHQPSIDYGYSYKDRDSGSEGVFSEPSSPSSSLDASLAAVTDETLHL
jgi:hypothetical protein